MALCDSLRSPELMSYERADFTFTVQECVAVRLIISATATLSQTRLGSLELRNSTVVLLRSVNQVK